MTPSCSTVPTLESVRYSSLTIQDGPSDSTYLPVSLTLALYLRGGEGEYAMTPVFLQVILFDMSPCASVRFRFDSKYCSRRPN